MTPKAQIKVMTIVGTRPEIIRLSRTILLLDEHVNHVLVHTGQNYDYELNEVFFKDLGLRKPDHFMNVNTSSLGTTVGEIIKKSESVLKLEKPDAVIVLGDTNSCMAAYMAKRLRIPIFHMEAGNRSFAFNVPEEINRRIIDHIADFNLVYTEHTRRHLISEGFPHRKIYLTGSPMKEVLNAYKPDIDSSTILEDLSLTIDKYFIISTHREENVDHPENLRKVLIILNRLASEYNLPVIVSTHPRTLKRIELLENLELDSRIQFLKPIGFLDYIHLQINALCTISDSGTICEESSILSFPAISLRQSKERPEAQDAGTIILSGFEPQTVLDSIRLTVEEHQQNGKYVSIADDYTITNTSWRVLKLIIGNVMLSNLWHGIK